MKQCILVFSLVILNALNGASQDKITKLNGDIIECKVLSIEPEIVEFKKKSNLDGPSYKLKKSSISQIEFENGSIEKFESIKKEKTLDETKAFLEKTISEHGFEEDSFNKPYKAKFEGDLLRLTVHRKSGTATNYSILYDFSNVYKWIKVDGRGGGKAYINVYVSIVTNEKKMKFDKHKLIMRVDDLGHAESILNALKHLNKILIEKKKANSGF